jgi:hypothetical protein
MLPFTVTSPVTKQEISIALDGRKAKIEVGRELTKRNSLRLVADCSVRKWTSAE